jgi:mannose-6-phosphate isomerase
VDLLDNAVRRYAWGSRTAIAGLLGRPVPAPHPEAELWLGAHPGDPSMLTGPDGPRNLLEVIGADPAGQLGPAVAGRWHDRLPFLLKVLAAEEPLSLQAHPSAEQAAHGFAAEERAGVPRDAPERSYPDPTAKPELLYALTEFHALVGFRAVAATIELLDRLDVAVLAGHRDLLAEQPDEAGLRALFTTWITLPARALRALLPPLLDACVLHVKEHGPFAAECRTVLELGERHPDDPGVLSALLLNRVVLAPGEAVFLPAGNLHAYLHGTGVEILANSDNTLRGGLTPKHVDVPELLRVLDFAGADVQVRRGEPRGPNLVAFPVPADEFELTVAQWPGPGVRSGPVVLGPGLPRIVLCTSGEVLLCADGGDRLVLGRGGSAWIAAADPPVTLMSPHGGQVFLATVGTSRP